MQTFSAVMQQIAGETISEIKLKDVQFQGDQAECINTILEGLKANKSVVNIDLSGITLTLDNIFKLSELLAVNRTIKTLSLANTGLIDMQLQIILLGLNQNPSVIQADISGNTISASLVAQLLACIDKNKAAPPSPVVLAANPTVPQEYIDSTTEAIMFDPVTASDGFNYERDSIETWLEDHNTSPQTGSVLPNKNLQTNNGMRSAIQYFLQTNPQLWNQVYFSTKLQNRVLQAVKDKNKSEIDRMVSIDPRLLTRDLEATQVSAEQPQEAAAAAKCSEKPHEKSFTVSSAIAASGAKDISSTEVPVKSMTLLAWICHHGSCESLQFVINRLGDKFSTVKEIQAGHEVELLNTAAINLGADGAKILGQKLNWSETRYRSELNKLIANGSAMALRIMEVYLAIYPALLEMPDDAGQKPLHVAAQLEKLEVIEFFLQKGAHAKATNTQKQRATEVARVAGKLTVVSFIEAKRMAIKIAPVIKPLQEVISLQQAELTQQKELILQQEQKYKQDTQELQQRLAQKDQQLTEGIRRWQQSKIAGVKHLYLEGQPYRSQMQTLATLCSTLRQHPSAKKVTIEKLATQPQEPKRNSQRWLLVLPNGQLVVGYDGGTIEVWDTASGSCIKTLPKFIDYDSYSKKPVLLPNGLLASAYEKKIKVWDIEKGSCVRVLEDPEHSIENFFLLHTGQLASVSTGHSGKKRIQLWDIASGGCTKTILGDSQSDPFYVSLNGQPAAVTITTETRYEKDCYASSTIRDYTKYTIKVWDVINNTCLKELDSLSSYFNSFSNIGNRYELTKLALGLPNGQLALVVVYTNTDAERKTTRCSEIKVWDLASGKCVNTLQGHSEGITCLVAMPNGNLVSGGTKEIKVWDVASGRCIKTLTANYPSDLAVLPNGQLASMSNNRNGIEVRDISGRGYFEYKCKWTPDAQAALERFELGFFNSSYNVISCKLNCKLRGHIEFFVVEEKSPIYPILKKIGDRSDKIFTAEEQEKILQFVSDKDYTDYVRTLGDCRWNPTLPINLDVSFRKSFQHHVIQLEANKNTLVLSLPQNYSDPIGRESILQDCQKFISTFITEPSSCSFKLDPIKSALTIESPWTELLVEMNKLFEALQTPDPTISQLPLFFAQASPGSSSSPTPVATAAAAAGHAPPLSNGLS